MKQGLAAIAIALVLSAACGRAAPPPSSAQADAPHQHHAPHGGTLVELGDEFAHVELVLDPSNGSLTAYVLDGEAEESVRLKQPSLKLSIDAQGSRPALVVELAAQANILTGETVGDSSEFSVTTSSLIGVRMVSGHLGEIVVKGMEFRDVRF